MSQPADPVTGLEHLRVTFSHTTGWVEIVDRRTERVLIALGVDDAATFGGSVHMVATRARELLAELDRGRN